MSDNVTQQLAESITSISYNSLPQEAIDKIKLMLLDSIGCALGGYVTDRARIVLDFIQECGGNRHASLIGNHRIPCALAAFGNSELINALDYDYIGPLSAHIGPYVTSPCLATAEREHASGKELILSLALANEIGGRIISSLAQHKVLKEEPPYYEESPRFTYSSAVFGGVAGAGKLLGLDAKQMADALGIAGANTAVPSVMKWEHMSGPSIMAKYNCWAGWIAQLATVAALVAEKGFTGDTTILDGEKGFWQIVGSPFFKVDNLLRDLGKVWHINEVAFKLYPTCYIYHTAIKGISNIIQENQIKPDDVEEIIIKGDPLLQTPNRRGKEIKSFADAQFSTAYNFALAVYHGNNPSPEWQIPATFNDPRIKGLMSKVKIEVHPRFDEFVTEKIKTGKLPIMWNSLVEVLANARRFSIEIPAPKGHRDNPASEAELIDKFRRNASYSELKGNRLVDIIEIVKRLEEIDDVGELFTLLTL